MGGEIQNNMPNSEEKIPWYIKYKQQIYGVAIFIFGALGGNVDRVTTSIAEFFTPNEIEERLVVLEEITSELSDKVSTNSGRILLLNTKVEALEPKSGGLPYRTQ